MFVSKHLSLLNWKEWPCVGATPLKTSRTHVLGGINWPAGAEAVVHDVGRTMAGQLASLEVGVK